jgi:hypothetical protein
MDVALRIERIPSVADATRKRLAFAVVEQGDLVIRSALPSTAPLNDHLVWFWGLLQNERRYLKSLLAGGATITVHARGVRGNAEVKPNGAEMLHLVGATLRLECE